MPEMPASDGKARRHPKHGGGNIIASLKMEYLFPALSLLALICVCIVGYTTVARKGQLKQRKSNKWSKDDECNEESIGH